MDSTKKAFWEIYRPRGDVRPGEDPQSIGAMGSIDFSMKLLGEAGVAIRPERGFGPESEDFLRMATVENEQRLRQVVREIDRCLK
jgi:alanine-synthesizing transaminase